jgi:hypothetical protein
MSDPRGMNIGKSKIGSILVLFLLNISLFGQIEDERMLKKAIKEGDLETVRTCLERQPGSNCEFANGRTGLYFAIRHDQPGISELILKNGADPDHVMANYSTLVWAVKYQRERIARYLIEYGADVNVTDSWGNTPLIYAAQLGNLGMCKILINRGADPLHKNLDGRRAIDYTGFDPGLPLYRYLQMMGGIYQTQDSLPSAHDGPHIFYEADSRMVLTYFEHIHDERLTRMVEKTVALDSYDTLIQGRGWDENVYRLKDEYDPGEYELETSGQIFAIGDVHGRYGALVNLLVNNGVIDRELNWSYGDGHLVFLGDVFDRGEEVTETLWLIYRLQHQAHMAGGEVHLLLGNHEIMTLTGDHRYVAEKYLFFSLYTGIDYSQWFERNTVLGKWLRSRNVMLRINDYMFFHAGISPQFAIHDLSLSEVNTGVRKYLYSDYSIMTGSVEDIILGPVGPLWYRGYGNYGGKYPEVTQEFVDLYLEKHGLKKLILGHNEQATITSSFEGKVISVDVAIDESGGSAQGLLITGDGIFVCSADGSREKIE